MSDTLQFLLIFINQVNQVDIFEKHSENDIILKLINNIRDNDFSLSF